MSNKFSKLSLSLSLSLSLLAVALVLATAFVTAPVFAVPSATLDLANTSTLNPSNADTSLGFSYDGATTTVTFDAASAGREYTITGTGDPKSIQFDSGAIDVTVNLSNIDITAGTPALGLTSGASVIVNLATGSTNTLSSAANFAGVSVPAGATVNVTGTGALTVQGGNNSAGIGGSAGQGAGAINILSGTVNTTGGSYSAGIGGASSGGASGYDCGTIHISGGTIHAYGNNVSPSTAGGAGIGGGSGSTTGSIRISGGTVEAHGSEGGAYEWASYVNGSSGIGAGYIDGFSALANNQIVIVIDGGDVTAWGGGRNAGIGGTRGSTYNVTINAGTVNAYGGAYGAGIGGGIGSPQGSIVITGGDVYAVGGVWNNPSNTQDGSGIGPGGGGASAILSLDAAAKVVAVSMGGSNFGINCTGNVGTGYYLNGRLGSAATAPITLELFYSDNDWESVGTTVLPADYRSVAFSTGSSVQRTYRIYEVSATDGKRLRALVNAGTSNSIITSQNGNSAAATSFAWSTANEMPSRGTINYPDESLEGFSAAEYILVQSWLQATSESGPWTNITDKINGDSVSLADLGNVPDGSGVVKKFYLAYSSTSISATAPTSLAQEVTISARPAAPTGLTNPNGTTNISGTVVAGSAGGQEWRRVGATSWNNVSANPLPVGSSGEFEVRVKAVASSPAAINNNGSFSSVPTIVQIFLASSISINSNADLSFTYPSTFATAVTTSSVTVTSNLSAPTWYYMTAASGSTKPNAGGAGWTTFDASTPPGCGEYWVYADVAADSNTPYYAYAISAVIKVTYNKKVLTVGGLSFSKEYDGTADVSAAAITGTLTLTGVESGDSADISIANGNGSNGATAPVYTYNNKSYGTSKAVSVASGGYVLGGAKAGFYALPNTYTWSTAGTITRKPITLDFTRLNQSQFIYNGSDVHSVTSDNMPVVAAGEIAAGDRVEPGVGTAVWQLTAGSSANILPNVGTGYAVQLNGDFVLEGADSTNYYLSSTAYNDLATVTVDIVARQTHFAWLFDGVPVTNATAPFNEANILQTLFSSTLAYAAAGDLEVLTFSSANPFTVAYDGAVHTVSASVANAVTGENIIVSAYHELSTTASSFAGLYSTTVTGIDDGGSGLVANYTIVDAPNLTLHWSIDGTALPQTGAFWESNTYIIALLGALALTGMLFFIVSMRKRRRD